MLVAHPVKEAEETVPRCRKQQQQAGSQQQQLVEGRVPDNRVADVQVTQYFEVGELLVVYFPADAVGDLVNKHQYEVERTYDAVETNKHGMPYEQHR